MTATTVANDGRLSASFAYPGEAFWIYVPDALVRTRSTSAGTEAVATFLVIPPTPTATPVRTIVDTIVLGPTASPAPPTPSPTIITSASNSPATVLAGALNLRRGPGTSYPVITVLERGSKLAMVGQNSAGDWLLVRKPDGIEGWVLRAFTDFDGTALIVPTPQLPTATPKPAASPGVVPTPVVIDWRGEYWANPDLVGTPVLVRNDAVIDFNWGEAPPNVTIPRDNFSARWTHSIWFDEGTYLFHLIADDGVRLWMNDQLIVDEWRDSPPRKIKASLALAEGVHSLRVEFYERGGNALIRVWWEQFSTPTQAN